jgi:hypothetical protein
MTKGVYCTYFDESYLSRGLALYQSLQRHAPGSRLWVLCLSETSFVALSALNFPNLVLCRLADFEASDSELAATRSSRSSIEYYFTCSPAWLLYVLDREPDAEWVTYLDSDLYFHASPEPIYAEMRQAAVAITPHRYPTKIAWMRKFGIYNVGWISVRQGDEEGRRVIEWWRKKCIEWCYDYVDGDRFADQGYLDAFPELSSRVKVIENAGVNLAPWNIDNYAITVTGDKVILDETWPLIFFHFQGLRKGLRFFVFSSHRRYRARFSAEIREPIYKPYVNELLATERAIGPVLQVSNAKPQRRSGTDVGLKQYLANRGRALGTLFFQLLDIVGGKALVVIRGTAR